jgi:3-methyl-2-oxobutanoate hydroxymethyltransferase
LALENAGACMIVLEAIPHEIAELITTKLQTPTIGIGAGPSTSGQVLVQMDALGMYDRFLPRFCKVYGNIGKQSIEAIRTYCNEVKSRTFPNVEEHCYPMKCTNDVSEFRDWLSKQ